MFDGIKVNITDTASIISFVVYGVFPELALTYTPFVFAFAGMRPVFGFWHFAGKRHFDLAPAQRKIILAIRQRPDAVQVIGQDHDRIKGK